MSDTLRFLSKEKRKDGRGRYNSDYGVRSVCQNLHETPTYPSVPYRDSILIIYQSSSSVLWSNCTFLVIINIYEFYLCTFGFNFCVIINIIEFYFFKKIESTFMLFCRWPRHRTFNVLRLLSVVFPGFVRLSVWYKYLTLSCIDSTV